jgi:hypothetical protein
MKDQYYKPQYHGKADNDYVERFWKTREEYPINLPLILVGANEALEEVSHKNVDDYSPRDQQAD